MSYEHVPRPKPAAGRGAKTQGRKGVHLIVEVRDRAGRIGIRLGCGKPGQWYSELSSRMVEDDITCEVCVGIARNWKEVTP
jgi:hypothetical protein